MRETSGDNAEKRNQFAECIKSFEILQSVLTRFDTETLKIDIKTDIVFNHWLKYQTFEQIAKINDNGNNFTLQQACPNVAFGGSFGFSNWGTCSLDMILKFGTQVKETKWGPRKFFWVRIFTGGFKIGLRRTLVSPGFWATGKTYKTEILHTASLIQFRTSEFYSAE